jgi:hypothetical protein
LQQQQQWQLQQQQEQQSAGWLLLQKHRGVPRSAEFPVVT